MSLIYQVGLLTPREGKPPHETALTKQAAPPTKKPAVMWAAAAAVFAIIAVLFLSSSPVMTTMAFGSVAVAIGFATRATTYNSMVFPRLYEQWARSFMCARCGSVFMGTRGQGD